MGQVILLSGEAGIGKLRLVQALKAHVAGEPHFYYECRCSPYYQHVAGTTLLFLGEFTPAREHFAHSIALDDSQAHRTLLMSATTVPRVANFFYTRVALWFLGYPDQALSHTQEALSRAQELSHPFSLTAARVFAAIVRQLRREEGVVQEQAEAAMALAVEQEFTFWSAQGTILRGWALAEQGYETGIAQMEQGLATHRTMGAELVQPYYLAMLVVQPLYFDRLSNL
jgi:predicted ATPase